MKELTTVTQLINDKIAKHKFQLIEANNKGDIEAFNYHLNQFRKMVAKKRAMNYVIINKGA